MSSPLRSLLLSLAEACRTSCHLGKSIIYDTVSELAWAVDIRTHGIVNVIQNVLNRTWAPSEAEGKEVPEPLPEDDCVVRHARKILLL